MLLPLLAIIFAVALGVHVSFTSPTATVPKERRAMKDLSLIGQVFMAIYKYSAWAHAIIEALILILPVVARKFPQSPAIIWIVNIFFKPPFLLSLGEEPKIFFPPLRMFGAFLVVTSGVIRYMCFHELGRHFTFHVALLQDHRLITTGPYSIVRHPSYTAGTILNIGSLLWHGTSGSWFVQSQFYTHIIAWVVILPTIVITGWTIRSGLFLRPKVEDEMLRKEFRKQWDEWAKRVPYKIFPGVY